MAILPCVSSVMISSGAWDAIVALCLERSVSPRNDQLWNGGGKPSGQKVGGKCVSGLQGGDSSSGQQGAP